MSAESLEEYLKKYQEAHKTEAAAQRRQQQAMQDPSFLEGVQSAGWCKSSSNLR